MSIATELATRARTPVAMMQHSFIPAGEPFPRVYDGDVDAAPRGLGGAAAVAMLQWALDGLRPGTGWDRLAHAMMRHASEAASEDYGLIGGWTGIALAARYAARGTGRYRQLIRTIRTSVAAGVMIGLQRWPPQLESSHEYELLQGYAGVYLLLDADEDAEAVERLLDLFDWLTDDETGVRWRLTNVFDSRLPAPMNRLGMSHGIAGILGALSARAASERAMALTDRIGNWLCRAAHGAPWKPQWGYHLEGTDGLGGEMLPGRVAWCHFGLGIAASLWNAGRFLDDDKLRRTAAAYAASIAEVPLTHWGMGDFGLCHGVAGNAALIRYLGRETGDSRVQAVADTLTNHLLEGFDASKALGYDTVVVNAAYSDPGFLTGSSGIALAALSLTNLIDDSWLEVLGLRSSW